MAPSRRIALATRELHPFAGGGIAPITAGLAGALSRIAQVTVFTAGRHRAPYEALAARGPVYGPEVELVFVEEPDEDDYGDFSSFRHAWSGRLFAALAERYAAGGPDLLEFPDYMAEGFVTIQARRTGEPFLRDTRIAVRTHTSVELTSILNGQLRTDMETRTVFEMERYCLRHADVLVHPGGDVLETYRRFYGGRALAPARRVQEPFHAEFRAAAPDPPAPEGSDPPLRLLYLGRLERRKGVQDLVQALEVTPQRNWRLTLLGADTDTAPLATSMRTQLEMTAGDDERIAFAGPVPREAVSEAIAAHDVVVLPSKWECWPNVVREAFLHNRPVLGTPVGGIVEMVEPGVSGWLAEGPGPAGLRAALERLFDAPAQVRALIEAGGPRAAFDRLVDADATRRDYLALLAAPARPAPRPTRGRASVSAVIPYFRMDAHVEETVESLMGQTVAPEEIVLVTDGSFRPEDAVVAELVERHGLRWVAQPNSGLGAARNLGVTVARGRFVLPLDPDNALEPEFVERCLHALMRDDALAYVTTWASNIDEGGAPAGEGYAPLGNWTPLVDRDNYAGDGTALIRRRVFDRGFAYSTELTSYEDWFLYRRLHHAGLHGDVVPRRLFRYRIRPDSMLRVTGLQHHQRIYDEMNALLAESGMRWSALSA